MYHHAREKRRNGGVSVSRKAAQQHRRSGIEGGVSGVCIAYVCLVVAFFHVAGFGVLLYTVLLHCFHFAFFVTEHILILHHSVVVFTAPFALFCLVPHFRFIFCAVFLFIVYNRRLGTFYTTHTHVRSLVDTFYNLLYLHTAFALHLGCSHQMVYRAPRPWQTPRHAAAFACLRQPAAHTPLPPLPATAPAA